MKQLDKKEISQLVDKHRFIPLFSHEDVEVCKKVIQSAYDGGVRLFEFTNRTPNALDVFEELSEYCSKSLPGIVLGAGTIMNKKDAKAFYKRGAQFIVAPVITPEVGVYCRDNDIFWCPGGSTLNEIVEAHDAGADLVKIFPASYLGGPGYLEALRGPCPNINVLITGGVENTEESLGAWFKAGAKAVGMGSNLFRKDAIAAHDYGNITSLVAQAVRIIDGL
ncbi:MAG TPA: bifunctional 4-hydroxy-2-oxoglutarate aldolase/2-dehydro-3-deoxy-phosphogluconate aldolase [Chitinophagaceae bacterium]|jgi:2-dehydro-3-deoxyphosphogluconate aldolase/(4S)-4-hydroxy-2-oxoglutarate aldolase|nr:bifunctional 4-hydroxy-2-oxoglutarate aldolase/2-dehydro-3-deoxy-phosphogluconate aldolase [Chitinophagaceae bacterium]